MDSSEELLQNYVNNSQKNAAAELIATNKKPIDINKRKHVDSSSADKSYATNIHCQFLKLSLFTKHSSPANAAPKAKECEAFSLELEHIYDFILNNLKNVDKSVQMTDLLQILDYSIRSESLSGNRTVQLEDKMLTLLNSRTTAEDLQDILLDRGLQVLFQTLQSLSLEDIKRLIIGEKVFLVLIRILFRDNTSLRLNANILACLKLYASKFEAPHILANLWLEIESSLFVEKATTLHILIALFDDFAACKAIENFQETIQTTPLIEELLKTEEHDKRKCAYYLLKKSYVFFAGTTQFWTTCISILENLEENQSHLILPSLELLKSVKPTSGKELSWLNILYQRILRHENILIRRWVLEYFLEYHTLSDFSAENIFHILQALNETSLYNIEGYMLSTKNTERFLPKNKRTFFKAFGQINWKAVPLHFWLKQLLKICKKITWKDLASVQQKAEELLLNLASKIRVLQNVALRRDAIELFNKLFHSPIEHMKLRVFVDLTKKLYNVSDHFSGSLFWEKLKWCHSSEIEACDQRFYEIFTNNMIMSDNPLEMSLEKVIYDKLEGIDCVSHGYLSLFIVCKFKDGPEKRDFCGRHYGLDMLEISQIKSFNALYGLLWEKLGKIIDSKFVLKQKAMDFYICNSINFKTFTDILNCDIKLDEIINAGSQSTLLRLAILLEKHKEKVEDNILESLINGLSDYLKNKHVCCTVLPPLLKYLTEVLKPDACAFWVLKILNLDLENVNLSETILHNGDLRLNDENFLLQGALGGDAKTGDSRIEEAYINKFCLGSVNGFTVRKGYVFHIKSMESETLKKSILLQVCELAKELNIKKPRYFAHSKEHRLLTRITCLLWSLRNTEMDDETSKKHFQNLWNLLMNYNNQPNVAIIYECLLGRLATFKTLIEKIKDHQKKNKFTSSQEVSIIMLLYRYFERNSDFAALEEYSEVISFLWPLTMGSSFQTRLYAQLVLVVLIRNLEQRCQINHSIAVDIQTFISLKTAIEQIIGKAQLNDFLKDVRFTSITTKDFYNEVMYLTLMPYDEYQKSQHHFDNEHNLPTKKLLETAKGENIIEAHKNKSSSHSCLTTDVQRKLNPTADFLPQSNLISYPAYRDHELYVIASFIDKIPNLGGIARTCEVLGIRNLVMASKADITKADFKNLSMTAERTLNIIEVKPIHLAEFLIQKKIEGFAIVGAEQTANSCNFVDFKFPKRSLLLLGHEKEGIPPNFLNFLDFAVEIPQFGMVRSLNVHVTGALFMWEYCKQHIYKKF